MWRAIFMIVLRWASGRLAKSRAKRHARRAARHDKREPLPQLWATGAGNPDASFGTARRAPGGIDDFREGDRHRPDFNPSPGPRDW